MNNSLHSKAHEALGRVWNALTPEQARELENDMALLQITVQQLDATERTLSDLTSRIKWHHSDVESINNRFSPRPITES